MDRGCATSFGGFMNIFSLCVGSLSTVKIKLIWAQIRGLLIEFTTLINGVLSDRYEVYSKKYSCLSKTMVTRRRVTITILIVHI